MEKRSRAILRLDQIPEHKDNPEFYNDIESDNVKSILIFQLFNEIRKYDVESLSNDQCRTILAKAKGITETIDMLSNVKNLTQQKEELTEEEL